MAWGKKELPKYPPLGFSIGEFIRDKVKMSEDQREVINTLYYDNAKIVVAYSFNEKSRVFMEDYRTHVEVDPEYIKKEIEELEKIEKIEVELKEAGEKIDDEKVREMLNDIALDVEEEDVEILEEVEEEL